MYKYNPLLVGKLDQIGANELNDLDDVNTAGTVGGYVLTYGTTLDTWTPKAAGAGDMLKSVYDTSDDGVVDNSERLESETLATVQAHTVDAINILGTIADANIPDVETLSYSVAFADAQIPTLDATKIISGTFDAVQIPDLPTSRIATGTFVADRIPTMENLKGTVPDGKIPDVDSLSYGAAFAAAQIPNLAASKITTGTFGLARIPTMDDAHIPDLDTLGYGAAFAEGQIPNLPTTKITSGTLGLARIPSITNAFLAGDITSDKISALNGTALSYPLNADTVGTTAIKAAGVGNDELAASGLDIAKFTVGTAGAARIPSLPAARITTGTFGLARIPAVDDARIPDLDTLSYGAAFAVAQIPNLAAAKITTGTFGLARIPSIDDARIPDVDTLSYGAAFATAQVPSIGAYKITTGTFTADRIPALANLKGTVTDAKIPDLETLSYGAAFSAAQIPNLDSTKVTTGTFNANRIPILPTSRITTGTFGLARIPAVDDARIPNLETLSYGAAFATAQIPAIGAYKITSGTLAVARHETLDNLNGTVTLSQIPTMDDGHIPDLDTLSYAAAFATAQIPGVGAYKISAGTLNADRIPSLPTARVTTGTFNSARIPDVGVVAINYVIDGAGAAITAGTVGFLEVPFACHVDRWTLLADQHGSVVIDIWRDAYSNYPPTDADSMSGTTNMPAISGTIAAQGTDLSGWGTQGIASGDILAYHVDSCSSIELCTIALKVTKV